MKILTIIPIAKGIPRDELSYFSAKPVSIGTLVTVMFGNRSIRGIVIDSDEVRSMKSSIKSNNFKLRNITTVHTDVELPRNVFSAAHATAKFFAQPTGKILKTLLPDQVLEYYITHPISTETHSAVEHNKPHAKSDIGVLQIPTSERVSYYKTLIRENLGRHTSTMILVPSTTHAEKLYDLLKNGISDRIVIAHSKKTKKHIEKVITRVIENNDPVVLIATTPFSSLIRTDWNTIIVEASSSPYYRYEFKPVFDMRFFIEKIATSFKGSLIYADTLIALDLRKRIESREITDLRSTWHIAKPEATFVVDMKEESKNPVLHTKTFQMIDEMISRKSHGLLLTTRKGIAPMTVCSDCKTIVSCPSCQTPLVLHRKKPRDIDPGESADSRIYLCHNCMFTTRPIDRCAGCGSWKLTMLGISTDSIVATLSEKFPTTKLFLCDGDHTPTPSSVEKTILAWQSEPGSILVATPLIFPYIESVPYGCIVSMDSLLSIPSYTGAFTGLHTVVSFLEKIESGAIVQTRNLQSEPIQAIINENLSEFISQEQSSRTQFGYPPATVLVKIILEVLKADAREATEYLETCLAKSNPDILAKKSPTPAKIIIQAIIKIPSPEWNDDESLIRRTVAELSAECAIEVNPESVL